MRTNLPINLIVGSEDQSHLAEYAAHPSVRIVPWDMKTLDDLRRNCTLNKIRALRWGEDAATLICEDDILFHPTWFASLQLAAAEMRTETYILSLFAAKPELEAAPLMEGKRWLKRYPIPILQGAQALFYPAKTIRNQVADYLTRNINNACGDHLIGRYARDHAALYVTREVLVEHIGAVSCFPTADENGG
ncbi:MAG: hypothetical protein HYR72_06750 [Deltaproteobacteria bacterium]|nr:hypothetical protein [Deltaproteobacteria bacterium]MBI3387145.1 hypothetical protein [Deltaproteobacteria bacterium]